MQFYSTNNPSHHATLRDAVLNSLAPDGGLYMPCEIPQIEWDTTVDFHEHAFRLARPYLMGDLTNNEIRQMIANTLTFDAPVRPLTDQISVLELFHGPTCAFKDFGARFMAQLVSHFAAQDGKKRTILVATSGDTGSAVAAGFLNVPGIRVVILYPSGKVSDIQERQLTTMGGNITALEIDGVFDDCQRLVKQAFIDPDLAHLNLTSANSINIARLIPQMFYYAWAVAQTKNLHPKLPTTNPQLPIISVPSGNFGNLTAGLMAKRMGVPIGKFIAATNANDVVPEYLETAIFRPRPSIQTISNAMDVGNPSNFARILALYDNDVDRIQQDVIGYRVTDEETRQTIRAVFSTTSYILDPHAAVAYTALSSVIASEARQSSASLILATAHPAKFPDVILDTLGIEPEIPPRLATYLDRPKQSVRLPASYDAFKQWIIS